MRISLEELRARPSDNAPSEAHEVVQLLADLPDLWDVKMDSETTDCAPSRFTPEGSSPKNCWPHPVIANGHLLLRDRGVLYSFDVKATANAQ